MDIKRGIPVSPGVAIGPALVLDTEGILIPQRTVPPAQVDTEIRRLAEALQKAGEDAEKRKREVAARLAGRDLVDVEEISGIFSGHADLFAKDHRLRSHVESLIRAQHFSAEYAVNRAIAALIRQIGETGGGAFARFAADLRDLEKQLITILVGARPADLNGSREPVIILAHDLTPSETAQLDPKTVHAFATESGGPTSHTAIMAGALEIPAVVGIGRFLDAITPGDVVIVDGTQGLLIVDPDAATLGRYEALRRSRQAVLPDAESLKDMPPLTKDGVRLTLLGNIEFPSEAKPCLERGADGVGLYRTEFLYVNKTDDPTEDEHFAAYTAVLAAMGNRPVVIRTLDVGADKFSSVTGAIANEKNPFLGLRSVRLCLKNKPLFKTQLRAILRASVHGDLRVMFPMVSTVMELRECRSLLMEAREDLEEEGIPFKLDIPIGTMIEVPSAALMADVLAKEVDFFSIGTNDLVQYTLAADRNNEQVAELYSPVDPAVLRLIQMVVEAARREDIEVNVCGEMSGEAMYAPLLIGMGLRSFSATPRKLPEIKRVVRSLTIPEAERVAREALRLETAREVTTYLREQLRRILPETAD